MNVCAGMLKTMGIWRATYAIACFPVKHDDWQFWDKQEVLCPVFTSEINMDSLEHACSSRFLDVRSIIF